MKVLLTGGAGFVGARVAAGLVRRGHKVALLLRPSTATHRISALLPIVKVICCDLGAIQLVEKQIVDFEPECCLHFAWYAEPGKYLDSEANFDSLFHTVSLMRFLAERGCGSFVGAGTCAEYVPTENRMREDSPVAPSTLYAASKLSALMLGQQYAHLRKINFAWGRIFLLYGSGEDQRRAIPSAIRKLRAGEVFNATEGLQLRDFLHVDDVASAFLALCEARADGIFNICSGEAYSMRAIFEKVQECLGLQDRIRFGAVAPREWDPPSIIGENEKLRALKWRPLISLQCGLEHAIRDI